MKYQTLQITQTKYQIHVKLNRPSKMNAMNQKMFQEIGQVFNKINLMPQIRVAVITANGKNFTAGLDLHEAAQLFQIDKQKDSARQSIRIYSLIRQWQNCFSAIAKCRVPVIAGIHGMIIGGGLDLISACDIMYCSSDAQYNLTRMFSIKEIDIGIAADLGSLQRIPLLAKNTPLMKFFKAQQAQKLGLVAKILTDRQAMLVAVNQIARQIQTKSPVGIWTIKQVLYKQSNLQKQLQYMARINSAMILTKDLTAAVGAFIGKRKAQFAKL